MIKLDKKLKKNIEKLVKLGFDEKGRLNEKNIKLSVETLQTLSGSKIIPALSEYLLGLKRELKKTTLEIVSAVKLSENHINQITKAIKTDSEINQVQTNLDSSLLGGIRIKIGDWVFDASVSQRIKQLKGAMLG